MRQPQVQGGVRCEEAGRGVRRRGRRAEARGGAERYGLGGGAGMNTPEALACLRDGHCSRGTAIFVTAMLIAVSLIVAMLISAMLIAAMLIAARAIAAPAAT